MVLTEEFDRLIDALEAASARYALAGGLAVAVWGAPRATKDIDLLVPDDDLPRVREVARRCGFTLEAAPMKFRDGTEMLRVSKVEGEELLTLDLMRVTQVLEGAWQSRQEVATERGPLWVVSREALIEMKVRAARPQDVYDVERLKDLDR